MVDLPSEKHIADWLAQLAQDEQRPISELLADMLDRYRTTTSSAQWARLIVQMADEDQSGDWEPLAPDLAERSREILDAEFGDYLISRAGDSDDDG
jgi:hypothetical protein